MIKFIKDIFKGINSSDGLESIMSLLILVGVVIPGVAIVWCIIYKIATLIF
jgi:hypothetical protein